MEQSRKFLQLSVGVFQVLAWISLGLLTLVGVGLLIFGGAEVGPVLARLFVCVIYVIMAVFQWFFFMFISHLTRVVLDLDQRVMK